MSPIKAKEFEGTLRNHMIKVPAVIRNAPGILVFGKRIKSLVYSTDVAIIKNTNADAIMAVYPFTPQPVITQALITAADVPVFAGVGGGTTQGKRVINLALDAEFKGAIGVVLNSPTKDDTILEMASEIDIPIVVTVVSEKEDFQRRLDVGVAMFNVSGAAKTTDIVKAIKDKYPDVPVIATGGPTEESILKTVESGADAVTFTPPTNAQVFKEMMERYRGKFD